MPKDASSEPRSAEAPSTIAGKALVGWIRPNLRGGLLAAVRSIEAEAGRTALSSFRERVATSSAASAQELLSMIDEALAESPRPRDR